MLTVLFWIKVMRMDNVVLFLMLEKKLSAFHHWIWYYLWACHWWPLQCWGFPGGSDGKESTCKAGGLDFIPRLGRSPGGGNGKPLQYYCLENPMDRGAWQASVHGVAKSQTQLKQLSTHCAKCNYHWGSTHRPHHCTHRWDSTLTCTVEAVLLTSPASPLLHRYPGRPFTCMPGDIYKTDRAAPCTENSRGCKRPLTCGIFLGRRSLQWWKQMH